MMPDDPKYSIVFVTFSNYPDQGSTAVYEYSQRLVEKGNEVKVISVGGGDEEKKIGRVTNYCLEVDGTKRLSASNLRFTGKARKLLTDILCESSIDIVHVMYYAGCSRLVINRGRGPKWVCDVRSGAIRGPIINMMWGLVERMELVRFDHTFYIDESLVNVEYYSLMPLGVNIDHFKPNPMKEEEKENIRLVYCGSLNHERRLENVLKAVQTLKKRGLEVSLTLIGSGDARTRLEKLAEDYNIKEQVVFTGYLEYNHVPNALSLNDYGVAYVPMVSEYNHQPPLKTLEYLSCGLPVIATNTAGNRKYVVDGLNGVLVGDSPSSMVEAVERLHRCSCYKELSEASRRSVLDHSWDAVIEDYLIPVYRSLRD